MIDTENEPEPIEQRLIVPVADALAVFGLRSVDELVSAGCALAFDEHSIELDAVVITIVVTGRHHRSYRLIE